MVYYSGSREMKALQTFITTPWLQFDVLLPICEGKQLLSLSCEVLPQVNILETKQDIF